MKRAVFGMGIALINHWPIIKEKFDPQFVVDNNPAKWGKIDSNTGLICKSFDSIIECPDEIEVLITVGDNYAITAISNQLNDNNIKYKILVDLFDEWYKDSPLPEHLEKMSVSDKKIILFNTPEHDNVGDHLISIAAMQFIEDNFSKIKLFEVTDIEYLKYHEKIKVLINEDDILLITGGGFAGSLWLYNGENNIRNIIQEYPDNRIILLPQTIYFEDNERGRIEYEKTKAIYNSHKNLILCAREKSSYELFKSMVTDDTKVILFPDLALFYNYNKSISKDDKLALVCFRKDKEKILSDSESNKIIELLKKNGYAINTISMHSERFDGLAGRNLQVESKLDDIAKAQIVVTDTLHCMISSALVGTSCFAFDNLSGKVGNVYKWIEQLDYVHMCKTSDDIIITNRKNKYVLDKIDYYKSVLKKVIAGNYVG